MKCSIARFLALACAGGACEAGWSPSGVGPGERASPEWLALTEGPAITLDNDVLPPHEPESPSFVEAEADAAGPHVLYLAYADGGPSPDASPSPDVPPLATDAQVDQPPARRSCECALGACATSPSAAALFAAGALALVRRRRPGRARSAQRRM